MSSLQRTGYESARPTHLCAATGRAFESGERYVATLTDAAESDELVRVDYSAEAWDAGARPARPVIAVWRSTEADRDAGPSFLMEPDDLLGLFEGMEPAEEGRAAVFRYLLALLLLRKRFFRIADQRVGAHGRPVLELVRRGGPKDAERAVYEVVDPGMDEEAISAGIEELSVVLADGAAQGGGS